MSKQKFAELPKEEQEKLIQEANEVGLRGIFDGWNVETLKTKIEERKSAAKNARGNNTDTPDNESSENVSEDNKTENASSENDGEDENKSDDNSEDEKSEDVSIAASDESEKDSDDTSNDEKSNAQKMHIANSAKPVEPQIVNGICHICRSKVINGKCTGCGFSVG